MYLTMDLRLIFNNLRDEEIDLKKEPHRLL